MTLNHIDLFDRWAIESRLREVSSNVSSVGQQIGVYHREIRKQHEIFENVVVELRSDMIESMGELAGQITAQGKQVGQNLVRIEGQQLVALQALQAHQNTLALLSKNLVSGFNQSFQVQNRLESALVRLEADMQMVRDDLTKIHKALADPEVTQALARHARALDFLSIGAVAEAKETIDAALENDGKIALVHLPEISFLRGCFHLGLYDDIDNAWLNPELARNDFQNTLRFASDTPAAPVIKDRLAYSHFLMGNYQTAERLYAEIEALGGHFVSFDRGRCFLGMNDIYSAAQLFERMFRIDPALALLPAADAFCQNYASFFREVGLMIARADKAQEALGNRERSEALERQERDKVEEKKRFKSEYQVLKKIAHAAFQDIPQRALENAMSSIGRAQTTCLDFSPELAAAETSLRRLGYDESLVAVVAADNVERLNQIYNEAQKRVSTLVADSGLRPWQPTGKSNTLAAQIVSGVEQMDRAGEAAAQGIRSLIKEMALHRLGDVPKLIMPRLTTKRRVEGRKADLTNAIWSVEDGFHKKLAARHSGQLQEYVKGLDLELERIRAFQNDLAKQRRSLRTWQS